MKVTAVNTSSDLFERYLAKIAAVSFIEEYDRALSDIQRPLSKTAGAWLTDEKKAKTKRFAKALGVVGLGALTGTALGYATKKFISNNPALYYSVGAGAASAGGYLANKYRNDMAKTFREYVDGTEDDKR